MEFLFGGEIGEFSLYWIFVNSVLDFNVLVFRCIVCLCLI